MVNFDFKKNIAFVLLFALFLPAIFPPQSSLAATLVDTESFTVSAKVGGISGSSGSIVLPQTAVKFSGEAYPNAIVTVLKNGIEYTSVLADSNGYFTVTLEELHNQNIFYGLYAKDQDGNRSLLINYPIAVNVGYLTHLSGIRFAPTLVLDKAEVKFGDYLSVSGFALPSRQLQINIRGLANEVFTLVSEPSGRYKITLPLAGLPKGDYSASIKYVGDTRESKLVRFLIGEANILTLDSEASIPGDCNVDRVINLVDFSVLAFWYGKKNPPRCVDTNSDNTINLVDFSILAFYWTG